jgi:hypothetical protein
VSTGLQVTARNMRLVRIGAADLALQFEFANEGTQSLSPADLGVDPLTHVIAFLVDLPRGTGYATQRTPQANPDIDGSGPDEPRASATTEKDVAAGETETVTLVFPAPPAEATSMLVLVDGFTPVKVPIQAQDATALTDDPVLHVASSPPDELNPAVQPLVCATEGQSTPAAPDNTSFRLPSDVLFPFGSATLSPAAAGAIGALTKQITATSGTVMIDGYTDAIGSDADNQKPRHGRPPCNRRSPRSSARISPTRPWASARPGLSRPTQTRLRSANGRPGVDGRGDAPCEILCIWTPGGHGGSASTDASRLAVPASASRRPWFDLLSHDGRRRPGEWLISFSPW